MTNPRSRNSGSLLRVFGVAAGGWVIYNWLTLNRNVALPPALNATRRTLLSERAGVISFYEDTSASGRPLVLVHSINAGASAYEMRPIFEHYRGQRPVYALDLPGFGFSERSDREYTPELYAHAILDFLTQEVREPADVIALSLGSEFAARAAYEQPERITSLALISPSGFSAKQAKRGSQQRQQSGSSDTVYRVIAQPLIGQLLFDALATRASLHGFLQQSFEGAVDAGLEAYAYATTHQRGARFAPLYFVSGKLFTSDVRESIYARLTQPVCVLYDRDFYVRFDLLPDHLAAHPNWSAARIAPTKGLPQFEQLAALTDALDRFWAG